MNDQPDFIGRFPIIGTLGVGGMGVVYHAQDPDIGRSVAIKVLHANRSQSDLDRFKNEARTIGELSHPNIVVLLEYGVDKGHPLLVMEYLEGKSLEIWMQSPHKLEEHKSIIADLCDALTFAHNKQILHRDLKPGNVQVLPGGQAKLLDFGIARSHDTNLTMSGMIVGTPKYLAPECLKGGGHSRRSDCYSLGLLAYTMLSGHNPFSGNSQEEVIIKQLTFQPRALHDLNSRIPVKLSRVIERYLNKKPDKRPDNLDLLKETLSELRSEALLNKVIRPVPKKASADTFEETLLAAQQPIEEPKRDKPIIIFKLALVVIVLVGGWILWGQYNGATRRSIVPKKQDPVVETAPKTIVTLPNHKTVAESTVLAPDEPRKSTANVTADTEQATDNPTVSDQIPILKDSEALTPREVSTPVADVSGVTEVQEQNHDEFSVPLQPKAQSVPTEAVATTSNSVNQSVASTIPAPASVATIDKPREPADDEFSVPLQPKAQSVPTKAVETTSTSVDKSVASTIPAPASVATIDKPREPANDEFSVPLQPKAQSVPTKAVETASTSVDKSVASTIPAPASVATIDKPREPANDEFSVPLQPKAQSVPTKSVETNSNKVDKSVAGTIPAPASVGTVKPSKPTKTVSNHKPRSQNTVPKKRDTAKEKKDQQVIAHKRPIITLPTFSKISRNVGMTLLSSSAVFRGKTSKLLIELAADLTIDGFKVFRGQRETSAIRILRFRKLNNKRLEVILYVSKNATLGNYILYGVHKNRKTRPIDLAVSL